MNVLVSGGNGFFGRKLVTQLLEENAATVVSMDVTPPRETFLTLVEGNRARFHFVRGDVSQLDDILAVIKQFSIGQIVNLAYLMTRETESMPRLAAKVNVLGVCNVFEAARLLGVSRVIYLSSNAAYGPQSDYGNREVTEEDRLHPTIPYGIMKQLNEMEAARYSEQYGLSIIGLRPSHGFGHGREAAGVAKRFSAIASLPAVGKSVSIEVVASSAYSLAPVDDVARFIRILLRAPAPKHRVYNIAGPQTSLQAVAAQVRAYLPQAQIEFGQEDGDLKVPQRISIARAKEEFGFKMTPLPEAVLTHINDARREAGLPVLKP